MKRILYMIGVVFVAALVVAIVTTFKLNGYLQSLIYLVLIGLVIYAVSLIMRMDK